MSRVQKLIRLHGSNEISNLISLVVHWQDFLPSFERVRVLAHTREPPAVEFKLTPPPSGRVSRSRAIFFSHSVLLLINRAFMLESPSWQQDNEELINLTCLALNFRISNSLHDTFFPPIFSPFHVCHSLFRKTKGIFKNPPGIPIKFLYPSRSIIENRESRFSFNENFIFFELVSIFPLNFTYLLISQILHTFP